MVIKSNSIILAADSSPAFVTSGLFSVNKKNIYPLSFVQNLSFDIPNSRARMKQVSSQNFAYDSLQFSPVISLSFDFISSHAISDSSFAGEVPNSIGTLRPFPSAS